MNALQDWKKFENRRRFLGRGRDVIGFAALQALMADSQARPGAVLTHFPAKAKRVIYLHMVGGPAQMDLFDYKPEMVKWYPAGAALDHDDQWASPVPGRSLKIPVRPEGAVRDVDERRIVAVSRAVGR